MGSKYNEKYKKSQTRKKSLIQFYLHNDKYYPNIVINSPSLNPFSSRNFFVFSASFSCSKKDNSFSDKSTKRTMFTFLKQQRYFLIFADESFLKCACSVNCLHHYLQQNRYFHAVICR